MALYTIETSQSFPAGIGKVWDFISSPGNLKTITPPGMEFNITTKNLPDKMYPGMIIAYKLKPLPGFRTTWVTEITHAEHLNYFIDEQRMGPYKFWHHLHRLKNIPGGVLMEDIINYRLPFGFLGSVAHALFVRKKLESILQFRRSKLEEIFGKI